MTPDPSTAILIVDDQPIVVELLRRMLAAMGLPGAEAASDGCDALLMMRRHRFALVIADITMSPMTGLQMLRAMRADAGLKDIPVLMMTASRTTQFQDEARIARVNGYLIKPFTAETLRESVLHILRIWGTRRAGDHAA